MTPERQQDLDQLLSALCDEKVSPEQIDHLEELLRSDAECRTFYLRYVDLHDRLMQHPGFWSPRPTDPAPQAGATTVHRPGASLIYVNGILAAISAASSLDLQSPCKMEIGGNNFAGDIDEVRVSKVTRSADWVKLEYENQRPQQTLTGSLVRPGTDFAVTPTAITMLEGESTTLSAKVSGAQKLYWILEKDGAETTVAVDCLSYTLAAGRVAKDTSLTPQLKAPISAGSVSGNIITLKLIATSEAKVIGYISGRDWDGKPTNLIYGANGIAALTFCDVPIDAKAAK